MAVLDFVGIGYPSEGAVAVAGDSGSEEIASLFNAPTAPQTHQEILVQWRD
jgi:hypothetical protein